MGIDAGFDMVPRLSKKRVDRRKWQSFIKAIREHYQNDDRVEIKMNYIEFKAGEHPLLPFEGHKFLRFSSKISGSHAEGVDDYINTVTRIASSLFGSRVQPWNDAVNEFHYTWTEVNDSIASYEEVCCVHLFLKLASYINCLHYDSLTNLKFRQTQLNKSLALALSASQTRSSLWSSLSPVKARVL